MTSGGGRPAGIGGVYMCSYPIKRGRLSTDSINFSKLIWQYLWHQQTVNCSNTKWRNWESNVASCNMVTRLKSDKDGKWVVFDTGSEGQKRLARDIVIPQTVPQAEVLGYLADLLHEHATSRHPEVKLIECI